MNFGIYLCKLYLSHVFFIISYILLLLVPVKVNRIVIMSIKTNNKIYFTSDHTMFYEEIVINTVFKYIKENV